MGSTQTSNNGSTHQAPQRAVPQTVPQTILILGSGLAGLSSAIRFAENAKVLMIAKLDAMEGATRYAQGGIASVWSKTDSFNSHIQDTLTAGAGLCNQKVVEMCVKEGPSSVKDLVKWGVEFTQSGNDFDLHKEGGHAERRILHSDDATGLAIQKALIQKARSHPNISLLENHVAIDLITENKLSKKSKKGGRVLGCYVLDTRSQKVETLAADLTLLATGGAGKVYIFTTNPETATGDGIAMAHRAGARVGNLEFMQFHPTCLYHPNAKTFLISEALRGEGAVLKNLNGVEFMNSYHPLKSLAPRDVVARAIDFELKRSGDPHVWLDVSRVAQLKEKFPTIYQTCLALGIDITQGLIPVVPAAHYTCGGVIVNSHGQTTLDGLYAVGEVSCTGLHGANRLASNSILESVVYSQHAFDSGKAYLEKIRNQATPALPQNVLPEWDSGHAVQAEERIDIAATWLEVRRLMWNYVGIVRSNRRLERAQRRLELIKQEVNGYYWNYLLTKDLIELRNLILVAELITRCAMSRKESRGLHFTVDYPETNDEFFLRDTIL